MLKTTDGRLLAASFPELHEERVARSRKGRIPSTGIILRMGNGSFKEEFQRRVSAVLRESGLVPEGHTPCEEIRFGSEEAWEHWKDNLPDFSSSDQALARLYWVTLQGSPFYFLAIVCSRLVADYRSGMELGRRVAGVSLSGGMRGDETGGMQREEVVYAGREGLAGKRYGDFAAAWNGHWEKARLTGLGGVWKNLLTAPLPLCGIPIDRMADEDVSVYQLMRVRTGALVAQRAAGFVSANGGSKDRLFLAAFFTALYEFTAEPDICVYFHYRIPFYPGVPGNYENVVPFRRLVFDTEGFLQFYHGMDMIYEKLTRSGFPADQLLQLLGFEDREIDSTANYGFVFSEAYPAAGEEGMVRVEVRDKVCHHDIMLKVIERKDEVDLELEYNSSVYAETTAASLLGCIGRHISSVLSAGDGAEGGSLDPMPASGATGGKERHDLVRIGGKRMSITEAESYLNHCPGIGKAVVVMEGEGPGVMAQGKAATVYYTGDKGGRRGEENPKREDIVDFLFRRARIDLGNERLILVDAFPMTADGEVDREALLVEDAADASVPEWPKTDIQRRIMEIWKDIIGKNDDIGIHENFFSAGGNSLKALRVISGMFEAFNVQLEMKTVYDTWTIEKLAVLVSEGTGPNLLMNIPIDAGEGNGDGLYPASHSQERIWAVSQTGAASAAYTISQGFELYEDIDMELFIMTLQQLVAGYEILRTVFVYHEGQLRQKVLGSLDMNGVFSVVSLPDNGAASAEEGISLLPPVVFDLSNGPLFNVRYLVSEKRRKYVLLSIHHIISDFWSLSLLFDLLRDVYNLLKKDKSYRMPSPEIQYRHFVTWQHKLLLEKRSDYIHSWKEKLKEVPAGVGLPHDRPRPVRRSYRGSSVNLALDPKVVAKLSAISRDNNANLLMSAFTIFSIALYKYTAARKNLVIVHLAGRDHEFFKKQIGLFVNTLPIVSEVDSQREFSSILSATKASFIEAYNGQYYPYDLLIGDLGVRWDSGKLPLSGIGFNWVYGQRRAAHGQQELGNPLMPRESGTSKFDILFTGLEQEADLTLSIEYNTDIYERSSISAFMEDIRLIAGRLSDGNTPLETLLEEERDTVEIFSF